MRRRGVGTRWWLAAIFFLIAVLTAALVATVSSRRADSAVRANSDDIAVGKSVSAAFELEQAIFHEGVVAVDERLVVQFANANAAALVGAGLEPGAELPASWAELSHQVGKKLRR